MKDKQISAPLTTSGNPGVMAIAQGLLDGGLEAAYNFPGFFSHDIFAAVGGTQISLNERAAYAEAFGSSLAGKRTLATFKNVGMNVASDAYLHSIIAGVRAGLVCVVTDDIAVWGSQESQDSRWFLEFYGGLWFEPATLQDAYNLAREAFVVSERLDVPVVIRLTNPFFELHGDVLRAEPIPKPTSYPPITPAKYVVHPFYVKKQLSALRAKQRAIETFCEERLPAVEVERLEGVVVVGAAPTTVHEQEDVLRVQAYPLPRYAFEAFVRTHDHVRVAEYGTDYVHRKLREYATGASLSSEIPRRLGTKTKFVKWRRYERFFAELQARKPAMVFGDITQFTVEERDTVQAALSLGTAVSMATGYAAANPRDYPFVLVGDSSFLHEGVNILHEAAQRAVRLGVVIFDNGGSWCTGGQPVPVNLAKTLKKLDGIQLHELTYERATDKQIAKVLRAMQEYAGVSVLRLQIPMGSFTRDGGEDAK